MAAADSVEAADARGRCVLATIVAIGMFAAVECVIGYCVFASNSMRFEIMLTVIAASVTMFAGREQKIENTKLARAPTQAFASMLLAYSPFTPHAPRRPGAQAER